MIQDESYPRINLFKNKRCKGWWPVTAREKPEKDDDDESDDDDDERERLMLKVLLFVLSINWPKISI